MSFGVNQDHSGNRIIAIFDAIFGFHICIFYDHFIAILFFPTIFKESIDSLSLIFLIIEIFKVCEKRANFENNQKLLSQLLLSRIQCYYQ